MVVEKHAKTLNQLAAAFRSMQKYTNVEAHDPTLKHLEGAAENFYKFILNDAQEACQYAANKLMDQLEREEE